jgi:hypothetical protein
MLIQTKRIKDNIISCGILKKDIRVRTPLIERLGGYDKTHICIFSNAYNKAKYILRLRRFFNLIITTHGKDISHISIIDEYVPDGQKGKITIYNIKTNEFKTLNEKKGI